MDARAALFRPAPRVTPGRGAVLAVAALVCIAMPDVRAADVALPAPGKAGVLLPRTTKIGTATIYRLDGRTTASGEVYNRNALTAAHRSLPLGTIVRVTNLGNQRAVILRINDRGPNAGSALINLTPRAAAAIGLHGITVGQVRIDVVGGSFYRAESESPPPETAATQAGEAKPPDAKGEPVK
jgi:rare lipoprotein A